MCARRHTGLFACVFATFVCVGVWAQGAIGHGSLTWPPSDLQVHLALTGDPTSLQVSWRTAKSGCVCKGEGVVNIWLILLMMCCEWGV